MSKVKAINLAASHWEWVSKMLKATHTSGRDLKMIGKFYRAAFIHGYKHGLEKVEEDKKTIKEILESE